MLFETNEKKSESSAGPGLPRPSTGHRADPGALIPSTMASSKVKLKKLNMVDKQVNKSSEDYSESKRQMPEVRLYDPKKLSRNEFNLANATSFESKISKATQATVVPKESKEQQS